MFPKHTFILITSSLVALSGCSDTGTEPVGPDVVSVTVTAPTQTFSSVGQTIQLQATALDATGNTVSGVAFSWSSANAAAATVNESGLATSVADGTANIIASTQARSGNAVTGSLQLTVQQVPAALTIVVEPGGAASGVPFFPQPALEIRDANGNRVTGDNSTAVTAALSSGPATLGGSTSATASTGLITFTDLVLAGPVGDHVLDFSGGGFSATSDIIALAPGPAGAANSIVTTSTDIVQSGTAAVVTLQVSDAADNAHVTGGLTVTFFAAAGSSVGTFGTTTDVGDGSYTANFTGDVSGSPVEIGAVIDGDTVTTPRPTITVVAGTASQIVFLAQPSNIQAGAVITPGVEVNVLDANGNLSDSFSGDVTLSIDNNPGAGTLGGTATRTAAGGVAVFDDLTVDNFGIGYTLRAVATGLTDGISAGFDVTAGAAGEVRFSVQPSEVDSAAAIVPGVEVIAVDGFGNVDAAFVGQITLVLAAGPGSANLSGTTTITAAAGVATFVDLQLDIPSGGYTLAATATALGSDTSTAFVVRPTGTTIHWTGTTGTAWDDPNNWNTSAAPTMADNVFIPADPPNQPVLNRNESVTDLYLEDGAQLSTNGFEIDAAGNVRAGNTITGAGLVTLSGTGKTVSGTLPNVSVTGTVQAAGGVSSTGDVGVAGTLTMGGNTVTLEGDFSTSGTGFLVMNDPADTLDVNGAVTFGGASTAGRLTAGLIRVGGNFSQTSATSPLSFTATGTSTVAFSGTVIQSIDFAGSSETGSRFANVEFANLAGVTFATDAVITGTATVASGTVTGTVAVTLVEGNLIGSTSGGWQVDTTMVTGSSVSLPDNIHAPLLIFPNPAPGGTSLTKGFKLVGDLLLTGQTSLNTHRVVVVGDFSTSGVAGRLAMGGSEDTLRVEGNATFAGMAVEGFLTDGVLEVTGDFTQSSATAASSFQSTNTHKVVFNGTGTQTITFASPGSANSESFFEILEIATADSVVFATPAAVRTLVTMTSGRATGTVAPVELLGNLEDAAGGRWQLDTTLITGGSVSLPDSINAPLLIFPNPAPGGTSLTKGFKLVGDLLLTGQTSLNTHRVVVVGDFSTSGVAGRLAMGGSEDTLRVEGNATFAGMAVEGFLTDGVLEVTGDFTQSSATAASSFQSTNTHKVVFNGTGTQTITFASPGSANSESFFEILEITNAIGVNFVTGVAVRDDLELSGQLTVAGGTTLSITDVLILRSTSTLNNNGTITRGSCIVDPGAVINGTNPC